VINQDSSPEIHILHSIRVLPGDTYSLRVVLFSENFEQISEHVLNFKEPTQGYQKLYHCFSSYGPNLR
jgi:hypothetical protein